MGKETDFILLQTKSTCWNSMVTRHVLYLVLQFGWKMLQSLKSKFVKHLPKILKSQSTTHIKQIKCYYMYTHKCIQKHTYTQHVSGHLTVVMTTDHILTGLKGSMVVRVKIQKIHKAHGKATTLSSTGSQIWQFQPPSSTLWQTVTTSPFPVFIPREHINQSLATGTPLGQYGNMLSLPGLSNAVSLPQRLSVKYFYVTSDI